MQLLFSHKIKLVISSLPVTAAAACPVNPHSGDIGAPGIEVNMVCAPPEATQVILVPLTIEEPCKNLLVWMNGFMGIGKS